MVARMTPTSNLRALLAAATKGPWYSTGSGATVRTRFAHNIYTYPRHIVIAGPYPGREQNTALIVAMRNSIEGLLDQVEAQERTAADVRDAALEEAAVLAERGPGIIRDGAFKTVDALRSVAESIRAIKFPKAQP